MVLGGRQPRGRHFRIAASGTALGDAVELPDAASDASAEVLEKVRSGRRDDAESAASRGGTAASPDLEGGMAGQLVSEADEGRNKGAHDVVR